MWQITLLVNILSLVLLWILSQVAITPAHNLLVQYGEAGVALPILTDLAIQNRSLSAAVPVIWAIITVIMGRRMQVQIESRRNDWLSLHTSLTLCLGLAVLLFFALAGILPVLKIGAMIG